MKLWDLLLRSVMRGGDRSQATAGREEAGSAGTSVAVLDAAGEGQGSEAEDQSERWWSPAADALLEMPPMVCPTLPTEALALERILTTCLEQPDLRLPSLPKAAERTLRLLGREAYDARRVAHEVETDQVISAAVLRLANCALYARLEKASDLQTAVARLGANALRSLMLQYSLQAAVRQARGGDARLAAIVWNGALASASILRGLAGLLRVDPEEAYLTGLLHDVGNLLVLREVQEQETLLRYKIDLDAFAWLCFEHHQRLGKVIGGAWELPEALNAIIADHHRPIGGQKDVPREVAMLALADMIKGMLGYAPPGSFDLLGSCAAQALGLRDASRLAAFLDELPAQLRHIPPTF